MSAFRDVTNLLRILALKMKVKQRKGSRSYQVQVLPSVLHARGYEP
jgi:hypothetical protein